MLISSKNNWTGLKAAELYREILLLDPENLNAKLQLAQTLREMGEAEEAIAMLENVRNIFPDDFRVLVPYRDKQYSKQKDRLKAMECFEKALSIDPTHIWANVHLGRELRESRDYSIKGSNKLQTALKYHPQHLNVLLNLGELEQKRHRLEDAIVLLSTSKRISPQIVLSKPSFKNSTNSNQF